MRPTIHLTAEAGWINDPHGLTWHGGEYHLFFQYVPDGQVWAPRCHWGHATSPDLLTWTHRGVALAPGDGDDGVWTGCLVVDGDRARILYTSVVLPDLRLGRVRLAEPVDDRWDEWVKGDVVVRPPADLDLVAFRDPFVVREGDRWRMLVGAAGRDGRALATTYVSDDLTAWDDDGVAVSRPTGERDPVWMGAMWECPQIFEVDEHWVMVGSVWDDDVLHHTGYAVGGAGSYRDGRFSPTGWGQLSHGLSHYAPSFFRDRERRACLLFWMRGVADAEQGWAGCLSVPHLLSVVGGRLVARPHPAVADRRGAELAPGATAGAFDVEWAPSAGGDRLVLTGEAGTETRLLTGDGVLVLERPGHDTWHLPWSGGPVRVIVDGPALEVSTGDGVLGAAIEPVATWSPGSGRTAVWSLVGH